MLSNVSLLLYNCLNIRGMCFFPKCPWWKLNEREIGCFDRKIAQALHVTKGNRMKNDNMGFPIDQKYVGTFGKTKKTLGITQ